MAELNNANKVETSSMELDEQHGMRAATGEAVGNIRELQNVVECSVILADTDTVTVDERWLLTRSAPPTPGKPPFATQRSAQEKAMIEAALTETQGRVSGPTGAAVRLQMPPSTLESKIRALGIDKRRFRRVWPAETSRTSSL